MNQFARQSTAMFDPGRPYTFHIELTDKCNAACPMCPRTNAMNYCRPNADVIAKVDLTLADFQRHFSDPLASRTAKVVFSGAYGDPLAARWCVEVVEHLATHGVEVAISTNGSLRTPAYFERLAHAMRSCNGILELHVDGLADTNPLYRVNTSFSKIMENARSYISAGGNAEWHFIVFRHNEHQIEEALHLSRNIGFSRFVLIDSSRFDTSGKFPYRLPNGEQRVLEKPERDLSELQSLIGASNEQDPTLALDPDGAIRCKYAMRNGPYISARGTVSACCWVADSDEEAELRKTHGLGREQFSIHHRPLEEIMLGEPFASIYAAAWDADTLAICRRKCGMMRRNRRVGATRSS